MGTSMTFLTNARHLRAHGATITALLLSCTGLSSSPAMAQAAPADDGNADAIVVTARRTSERLTDVPIAIQAFNAEELRRKNISGLEDIANYTPGVKFADFVTGFNGNVTIRGLQQSNVQNAVGNVGVFIDNIYLQRSYIINPGLGDYERIEIVKGPQSALYGENTFSGAINYVTRMPSDKLQINATASGGNAGYLFGEIGVGAPIIPDILGARVYYGRSSYGGTWRNKYPGIRGDLKRLGGYDRESYSGVVRFTPTNTLTVTGSYQKSSKTEEIRPYYTIDGNLLDDRMNCGTIVPATGRGSLWCGDLPSDPQDRRSGAGNPPPGVIAAQQPDLKASSRIWRANAEWKPIEHMTLAYTFGDVAARAYEQFAFQSNPYNPVGRTTQSVQKEGGVLHYTSHEGRAIFANPDFPLSGEIGYFHSEATDRFIFGTALVPVNSDIPLYSSDPLSNAGINATRRSTNKYKTDAVFGRLEYKIGQATLSGEVRRSRIKLATDDRVARVANPALPILAETFKSWLPRFTAKFQADRDLMLYVSAAKGEKAGGFNGYVTGAVVLLPDEQSFGPESNWTYEAGLKGSFFDRRLTVNLSAFYVDWSNKQTTVVPANYPVDLTAAGVVPPRIYGVSGSARSYGIEVGGNLRATDALRINYALTLQNPKYRNAFAQEYAASCDNVVCPRTTDLHGNTIEGVSKVQASAGADYQFQISENIQGFFSVDETFRGRQYAQTVNVTTIAPVWLTNLQAGANIGENWRVFLWAKNLFDRKYVSASLAIPTIRQYNVNLGERQTFGLTASFNY